MVYKQIHTHPSLSSNPSNIQWDSRVPLWLGLVWRLGLFPVIVKETPQGHWASRCCPLFVRDDLGSCLVLPALEYRLTSGSILHCFGLNSNPLPEFLLSMGLVLVFGHGVTPVTVKEIARSSVGPIGPLMGSAYSGKGTCPGAGTGAAGRHFP